MSNEVASATPASPGPLLRVATWNMDHWKQTPDTRREGWAYVHGGLECDVALLQESVPPRDLARSRVAFREIGGHRPWGTSVVAVNDAFTVEEIGTVRTRYASTRFSMLGTTPGTLMATRVAVPDFGPVTCVSVYGLINVYAQTTMLRIVADLIPLFDSVDGQHVVLGGDLNVTTATRPDTRELKRYDAILRAVESLGLKNVVDVAPERPPQNENCPCGAAQCHHIATFGNGGSQIDWLFATPTLASSCARVRLAPPPGVPLSDHVPIVADFRLASEAATREWDPESFVREVGRRHGDAVGRAAEAIVAWALRKHSEARGVALDRLPVSEGPDPELWLQLDFKNPSALGWTISLTATGSVVIQFQYMKLPPFNTPAGRAELRDAINGLAGISLAENLTGRPSFPLAALCQSDNLSRFLTVLDGVVDRTVAARE